MTRLAARWKRWVWLWVLPYVVAISTGANNVPAGAKELFLGNEIFWCDPAINQKCDWFEDLVFVLNEGHRRRMDPNGLFAPPPEDEKYYGVVAAPSTKTFSGIDKECQPQTIYPCGKPN